MLIYFFERARAPRRFLLGKTAPYEKFVNFYLGGHVKGIGAVTEGMEAIREVPGLL